MHFVAKTHQHFVLLSKQFLFLFLWNQKTEITLEGWSPALHTPSESFWFSSIQAALNTKEKEIKIKLGRMNIILDQLKA